MILQSFNSRHVSFPAFAFACLLGLSACQTTEQTVANEEDNLSAAGFIIHPADTVQKLAALQKMPQHKIVRHIDGDTVAYGYADTLLCNCLYIGTQQAYNQYRLESKMQQLTDEQEMAAQMAQDEAWQWGPLGWGPVESETVVYEEN